MLSTHCCTPAGPQWQREDHLLCTGHAEPRGPGPAHAPGTVPVPHTRAGGAERHGHPEHGPAHRGPGGVHRGRVCHAQEVGPAGLLLATS